MKILNSSCHHLQQSFIKNCALLLIHCPLEDLNIRNEINKKVSLLKYLKKKKKKSEEHLVQSIAIIYG